MPSAAGPALQGKSEALRVWIATGCKNDGYNDKHAACAQFSPKLVQRVQEIQKTKQTNKKSRPHSKQAAGTSKRVCLLDGKAVAPTS